MTSPSTAPAAAGSLAGMAGPIVLVGAGRMGGALLQGWLGLGLDPTAVAVLEPQPSPEIAALGRRGVRLNVPADALGTAAAVVLAVKPQTAPEVLPQIGALVGASTTVVSIMAGRTLAFLEQKLPAQAAVVRAMPNTPAAVGRGITVAVANARLSAAQRDVAGRLLAATGAVEWIDDEQLMDAVTAVSGSGPAYVFLLAETLAHAGAAAGLPADLADRLARATVAGSGELLARSTRAPDVLRREVTSPGGTTAAALDVLMAPGGMEALLDKAVAAATRRSRELAG
ncbi:MAG TPA: pyrroline-5-carboxylate reductase [Xanthobacteraceae bacterium]|nr:pyrroline-5-carboxylate reductase [Xanthobacteraceae bacterium]